MKITKKDIKNIDGNIVGAKCSVFDRTDEDQFGNQTTIGFFPARDIRKEKFDVHGNRKGMLWIIKTIEVDCNGKRRVSLVIESYSKGRKKLTRCQDDQYFWRLY